MLLYAANGDTLSMVQHVSDLSICMKQLIFRVSPLIYGSPVYSALLQAPEASCTIGSIHCSDIRPDWEVVVQFSGGLLVIEPHIKPDYVSS
jgi:hypothetical protein